jgi:putative ABC transport system substrate-binding protein
MAGPEPINYLVRAFMHGMRDLGYVEGQNWVFEPRSAEGRFERFGEIVAELVRSRIDVIVTAGDEMAVEAKRVTTVVPIVMVSSTDPVGAGIVASLARPGGNITGLTIHPGPEIEAKRLQLLKEALPETTRVAFLGLEGEWEGPDGKAVQAAAGMLGVTLVHAQHTPTHYDDAFALISRDRPHAVFVGRHPATYAKWQIITDFMAQHRLPGSYPFRDFVAAGGLMSYGVSVPDLLRRAAGYVDKILKGAKPADLPVQQPTTFELVINLKTAKALGITLPQSILALADEVIE